jgi:4-amino-4-deoxy-L-arabinose transferase-like glycosyltransferase
MRRWYLPLATTILVVAAFLRFWQLDIYPPGPHYDEGAYLLITRSIAFGGERPFPIVEAYQGREVLYMYLNAPLLHLFADNILTLHITSAFLNLLTLAAAMSLARKMFRGERGAIIALAVGVIFLISFPQLFIARQAFRAVTLPFMQAMALLFLWHGLRAPRRWGWLAMAGLFAGGALYTYMASRLFPLWLALGALVLLWNDCANWRVRMAQGVVFFGTLVLTAAPMVAYALQKPDIFWGRLGEVNASSSVITLPESILLHLRMFFIEGDPYFRYNIAGRPYFTLPEGVLLLVGLSVALFALWRRNLRPLDKAAYALALFTPLMVIPSVISLGGLPPSHMRSLGMIPLIFIAVAIGFEAVYRWLAQRLRLDTPRAMPLLTLLCVVIGAGGLWRTYATWASDAALFYETDADLSTAARWLGAHTLPGEHVYLAARDRSHPTVMIEDTPPITWIGTNTLFVPPSGESGLAIFPRSAPPQSDWRVWLEPGRIADLPLAPDGRTAFEAFRLNSDTPLPDMITPDIPSENSYLSLIGSYSTQETSAGTSGELIGLWRVLAAPPDSDLTPLIRLTTQEGVVLDRTDVYMTDTNAWEPGSVLMIRLPYHVPLDAAPGQYRLEVAWVARARDEYAPYRNAVGGQGGIWNRVGTTTVQRPQQPIDPDDVPLQTRLSSSVTPGITLLGYDLPITSLRPGESIPLRLVWQAAEDAPSPSPYRIILRHETDTLLYENAPLENHFPASLWRTGDVLREDLRLPIPREQANGTYTLLIETEEVSLSLGSIDIAGIARIFDPPSTEIQANVTFGDQISLYGYTLDHTGADLQLTLVWRAEQPPTRDYTVFVHLVDEAGNILAQRDVMPMQNSYPTSLWAAHEFVVDNYSFDTMTSGYNLRIGLYDATSGARLRISQEEARTESDFFSISLNSEAQP